MRIHDGTRAFVTGASRGIGRSLAEALAARGAALGLAARSAADLEALAGRLGPHAHALPCDVGDAASVAAAVEALIEREGGVDLVIANAGLAHYGPFVEQSAEHIEAMTRINWLGTVNTVRAALPRMLEQGAGHIVVVSSGAGLRSFPGAAVYGATKAAQRGFASALRHELDGTGVGVTTVFPGEIATSLHDHERDALPDWRSNEEESEPDELARAILAAVEADRRAVGFPPIVRLLGLDGIAPRTTDALLRRIRGRSAAPRGD
jgi:short-subunit dehydrogenase